MARIACGGRRMKCVDCPMRWCESNESVYPPEYGCEYGEEYTDEHLICFADGSDGCLKRRKTIEKALEENIKRL